MFSVKNELRIVIVASIFVITFAIIWIFFFTEDMGISTEKQIIENPVTPPTSTSVLGSINPEDFREITLDSRFEYYIKAGGEITFLSDRSGEVAVVILPGTIHHEAQTLPKDPKNNMVHGNYGDYSHTFNAPLISGVYDGVIVMRTNNQDGTRPVNKNFKLTVINEITNEDEAYTVAEHFLQTKISAVEDAQVKGWNERKKDIILTDTGWKVSLEFDYQSCGIDWEENNCTPQQEKATLLIKTNGIIEQI